MDTTSTDPAFPDRLMYKKERSYGVGILGLGYVFNISRKFSITAGGDIKIGMSFLSQFYTMSVDGEDELEYEIKSNDITLFLVSPVIKLQYFATPRVVFNAGYSYGYQAGRQVVLYTSMHRQGADISLVTGPDDSGR